MLLRQSIAVLVLLAVLPTSRVGAQRPPAEIVQSIERRGNASGVLDEMAFDGCPQEDARGREILDLVSNLELSTETLAAIPFAWTDALVACDYAPLSAWFDRALRSLLESGDRTNASVFLQRVGSGLTEGMRETLWTRVEGQRKSSLLMDEMAAAAIADPTPHGWVERGLHAFASRNVPNQWVVTRAGQLLREHPTIFLRTLTSTVESFSDERLLLLLQVIHEHIRGRSLGPQAPGINPLRWAVRGREGIPGDSLLGPVNQ